MSKKILIIVVALLCLLALPASALAADQLDNVKIDASVQTAVDATGGDQAVPVIVYAPDNLDAVAATVPEGVDTTPMPLVDGVAAYLTPDEIATLADDDSVTGIVADNPVFGVDYQSSMDITNLAIGLGHVPAPADGGPDGHGVAVAVLDSGISTGTDLGASRIVGWKDFVNGRKTPLRRRRARHVRGRSHRRRRHRVAPARGRRKGHHAVSAAWLQPPTSSASRCWTRPARVAPPR